MSQLNETFFTSIGCMDGRVQDVIAKFGKEKFGAEYPDTITEAGLVGQLVKKDASLIESLKFKVVTVSLGKHNAKGVIVHGHAECAGNPVEDQKHKEDIRNSVEIVKSLVGEISIVGVFVHRDSHNSSSWVAEELS